MPLGFSVRADERVHGIFKLPTPTGNTYLGALLSMGNFVLRFIEPMSYIRRKYRASRR